MAMLQPTSAASQSVAGAISVGSVLELVPQNAPVCLSGSGKTAWIATVLAMPSDGSYPLEFADKQCPASKSVQGIDLVFWLTPGPQWKLVAALASDARRPLLNTAMPMRSVSVRELNGTSRRIDVVQPGQQTQMSVGVPLRDVMPQSEVEKHRQVLANVLLTKSKPPLVRSVIGGMNDGLGVRNPSPIEYRKEFLNLTAGQYITISVLVTDTDMRPIAGMGIHGMIKLKAENSPVLNGLGTVYQVDVDATIGDPVDIQTYTPMYVGRRKVRYWLCVYHDLMENKVILTADTVEYQEFILDVGPGGNGNTRLAEYLVDNIKLSSADMMEIPFKGDREEKDMLDLAKRAKDTPQTKPGQVPPHTITQTTASIAPSSVASVPVATTTTVVQQPSVAAATATKPTGFGQVRQQPQPVQQPTTITHTITEAGTTGTTVATRSRPRGGNKLGLIPVAGGYEIPDWAKL